ncbi:MAG: hypothetical protein HEP71_04785 [Roseivirga sp.]|nr:hypothetical protein [Roseivirga sp.]
MAGKKGSVGKFLVELFIVFIGVYGAFELNRYQENNRERKIKLNYLVSFKSELVSIRSQTSQVKTQIGDIIQDFETKYAAGERPALQPPELYYNSALLITQIGLSDDVFVQLDPSLASSLSGGYDIVQRTGIRMKDFNDLCNRQLISNEPIEFYDRQGKLKPQYNWYLDGLKNLEARLGILINIIDTGAMPGTDQLLKELE